MAVPLGELTGAVLLMLMMAGTLAFIVTGSRPRRLGRPTHARRWSYLKRYYATGLAARVAAGIPLGWAVGQIGVWFGRPPSTVFVAAVVISSVTWTVVPFLEGVVGATALALQIMSLVTADNGTELAATSLLVASLVAAVIVASITGLDITAAPLVLAAVLELAMLALEASGGPGTLSAAMGPMTIAVIVAIVALIAVAPRLVLALVGVALVFGSMLALVLLGTVGHPTLVAGLAGMAGAAPVTLLVRSRCR